MKPLLLSISLLIPTVAQADSFILGAGRWTCQEVIAAHRAQDQGKILQVAGWLLGYWSSETKYRDDSFVNTVENAGGQAIYNQSVAECRNVPGVTMLYEMANSMIGNTH